MVTIDEKILKIEGKELLLKDVTLAKYNENKAKGLAYRLLQNLKANNQRISIIF